MQVEQTYLVGRKFDDMIKLMKLNFTSHSDGNRRDHGYYEGVLVSARYALKEDVYLRLLLYCS